MFLDNLACNQLCIFHDGSQQGNISIAIYIDIVIYLQKQT